MPARVIAALVMRVAVSVDKAKPKIPPINSTAPLQVEGSLRRSEMYS